VLPLSRQLDAFSFATSASETDLYFIAAAASNKLREAIVYRTFFCEFIAIGSGV
jgi:hypothetical protein